MPSPNEETAAGLSTLQIGPGFTPCAANRNRPCEYTIIVERQFTSVQQRNEFGREYTVNKGDKAMQVMCRWCRTRKPVE